MPKVSKLKSDKKEKPLFAIKSNAVDNQSPWYWIKNSSGKSSASVTFAFVSFWATTLLYILSSVKSCGEIEFREFDSTSVGAYLIPILTLYFGRRWTETKLEIDARNQTTQEDLTPEQ
jgi:hypothetical protein